MKIQYQAKLYKKIANFPINDIITITNRKGRVFNIFIGKITNLSWRNLQLLERDGDDRFSKMVLLYEKYKSNNQKQTKLSEKELDEISKYLEIYKNNNFFYHYEINNYISKNNMWDEFPTIRSLNNHGKGKIVHGIQPKYFKIICQTLDITDNNGDNLKDYQPY